MSETQPSTKSNHDLSSLCKIMATLRSPQGCPWDQQQSAKSLKPYILEETYELLEAIDSKEPQDICDELGDLILQVVFLAQIYSEQGSFDLSDVISGICSKMIRRHPHVFADADNAGHSRRWEQIKTQELQQKGDSQLLAKRLPASLPALKRTQKFIKKTRETTVDETMECLQRGQQNLFKSINESASSGTGIEEAMAQQLFDLVGLAVALHIDAEDLLRKKTTTTIAEIDKGKQDSLSSGLANS